MGRPVTDKQIYSLAVNNKLVKLVVAKGVGVAPPSNPSAGLFKEEPRLQFVVIVKMKDSVGTSISVMTHDESVARALYGPPGLKFLGGDPTGALWTDARSSTHVGRPCPPDTSEVKALQLAAEYAAELISKMN